MSEKKARSSGKSRFKEVATHSDVRHLRAFVRVAARLSFRRAAGDLFLTQPAITRIIQELENDIGSALFTRDNRQVRLTQAGSELLPLARAITDEFDVWIERARRVARGDIGALRLGFFGSTFYNSALLTTAFRNFRDRYPEVRVEILELYTAEIPSTLRARRIDLAFGRAIYSEHDLVSRVLSSEPLVAVVPNSHRLATRASVSIADLQDERFVTFAQDRATPFVDKLREAASRAHVTLHIDRELAQLQTILSTVASEHHIGVVTQTSSPARSDLFACIPFDDPNLSLPLVMSYVNDGLTPAAAAFAGTILTEIGVPSERSQTA
jgi:DNA-binding transcriptional LysR family regulator